MIYPPAAVRFVCNALHGIAPLFMSGRGGGGRGKGGKAGAGRSGISCNAFTPAKRRSLQQKSGPRSTAKKTALANTQPTRQSPRLHPEQQQRKKLPAPKGLHTFEERHESSDSSSSSSSQKSKDLLAGTQDTTTTVYGTMLPSPPLPQVQFQRLSDDKRNGDAYEESENEQEDNTSFGDGGEFSPIQGEQGGADSIQNRGVGQNNTCKKMELKKKIVEEYANVIRSLDTSLFQSSELWNDIYMRLAGGRMDKYGSKNMWKLWEEFQSEMKYRIVRCIRTLKCTKDTQNYAKILIITVI
jgi:hypothetical protein